MGTLDVITHAVMKVHDLPANIDTIDVVSLTADERAKGHARLRSRMGRSLRVSLPREQELHEDDVLMIDGNIAIAVEAADEDVLEVRPETARQWGVAAYVMGNLHRAVRFSQHAMRTPYEASTADALSAVSVPYLRKTCPLTGERIRAVGGHSHDN